MHRRLLQNGLLIVAAAVSGLVAPWTSAARADSAQVTVVGSGGEQQVLSLDALGPGDVASRAYVLRSSTSEGSLTVSGFSPAAILAAAGADTYGFSYLEVQRPAGGSVLLSRHQALDPGAFPEGPPVIYATETGTGFLRPSAGSTDLNAADSFEAPQGIALVLRSGSPLQVRAEASSLRTRPGRPVTFSAIVDRAGAGEQLTYSWYFDDGSSSTGARTRHRFSKRGSYDVVVGVTTPGDDAGVSAVVTVQVGAPLAGPDRKGGGRNREAGAPDHGAADGPSSGASTGGSAGTTAAAVDTAAPSQPQPDPHTRGPQQPDEPAGHWVSGVLVSGERAPDPPEPAAAARTGKLSQGGGGASLPGAALGLLATAGLLGLGALVEARSLLR
jgi:PKD domain